MPRRHNAGFILPLSIVLVLLLGISGMSFMQLDWLERRVTLNEVDNHGAFYLANAGIERARDVLKLPDGEANWTTVLQNVLIDDPNPDPQLCPHAGWKCGIIPGVGATVTSPDNLAFVTNLFNAGSYEVRVFNDDVSEPFQEHSTQDFNGLLVMRARGTIRGEQKIIQVEVKPSTSIGVINCAQGDPTNCPDMKGGQATYTPNLDGHDPKLIDPTFFTNGIPPIADPGNSSACNPANYYCDPTNFSSFATPDPAGPCPPTKSSGHYYFCTNPVNANSASNIVIVSTGNISLGGSTSLTNAILVSGGDVQVQGSSSVSAPPVPASLASFQYPAIIALGVIGGDNDTTITGSVYAEGSYEIHSRLVSGLLFGTDVDLKNAQVTDGLNINSYNPMLGFTYPKSLKTVIIVNGSWQEIQ